MDDLELTSRKAPIQDDGDGSLIRWMLGLSPEERLAVLQGFVDSAMELRDGRSP
jgi:hypothetical protein